MLLKALLTIFLTVSFMNISAQNIPSVQTTDSGLKYSDQAVGTGRKVQKGDVVEVHYTGWLYTDEQKGRLFDSSLSRNETFCFKVGSGMVIKGWDEGLQGMQIGGKRTLIIPPELGYGARGAADVIPPNATLIFDVELVQISSR